LKDLTNLKTYIIDSADPHEVDDAISLEIKEGNKKIYGYILLIHANSFCMTLMLI
jgi:exoribonuclease-2